MRRTHTQFESLENRRLMAGDVADVIPWPVGELHVAEQTRDEIKLEWRDLSSNEDHILVRREGPNSVVERRVASQDVEGTGGLVQFTDRINGSGTYAYEVTTVNSEGTRGITKRVSAEVDHRKIITILWDPQRPDHIAPVKSDVVDILFGNNFSVADYFLENSGGEFTIRNEGVFGWYDAAKPADHYWNHPEDANDGWNKGHDEKYTEAILMADQEFDFSRYDTNHDGVLDSDTELGILMVIPQNTNGGFVRSVSASQNPPKSLYVDGVRVNRIAEAYIGSPMNMGVVAHELSHLLLHTGDMYWNQTPNPFAAKHFSLMDHHWGNPHLDPIHKMNLGWIQSREVSNSGPQALEEIRNSQEVIVIRHPETPDKEYFVIENRSQKGYDSDLPDEGLAIWHVVDDADLREQLPVPAGTDLEKWESINGFWRKGVRLIRANSAKTNSLWDATNELAPDQADLRWHDGTTGAVLRNISSASAEMTMHIDLLDRQLGDLGQGIAAQEDATGTGFIVYSEEDVHERFSGRAPHGTSSRHLVVIKHIDGHWYYDDNQRYRLFSERDSDLIVASVNFDSGVIRTFEGSRSHVHGIEFGYQVSNLALTMNSFGGQPNPGEIGVEGTYFVKNKKFLPPAPELLAGDANADGRVTFADFLALSQNFGLTENARRSQGDFDGDQDVDFTDFLMLAENYGRTE